MSNEINTQPKSRATLIVSICLLLVAGVGVAKAGVSGWDLFFQEAGKAFGTNLKIDLPAIASSISARPDIGAEGDTFSTQKKVSMILSPDAKNTIASTTIAASFLNGSGVERIIKGCQAYFEGTGTWGGVYAEQKAGNTVLDFSTSTLATASSTNPLLSFGFVSSSLDVVSFTTNTLHAQVDGGNGNGWKRKWANGEYLNVKVSSAVSTTEAFVSCDYDLFN